MGLVLFSFTASDSPSENREQQTDWLHSNKDRSRLLGYGLLTLSNTSITIIIANCKTLLANTGSKPMMLDANGGSEIKALK